MSNVSVDLFAEDRAHEEFLNAMIRRIAREERQGITIQVRKARGGHGRALGELEIYQQTVLVGLPGLPDLLVVCIDANCRTFNQARKAIEDRLIEPFRSRAVIACPDPHIERWYLADPIAVYRIIGSQPGTIKKKCKRDWYKSILAKVIRDAGQISTLGGIEFAQELVADMDLYQAGRNDHTLKSFIEEMRNAIRVLKQIEGTT